MKKECGYCHGTKENGCKSKKGYAVANIRGKVVKMQRYIMEVNDQKAVVDHINRNIFDNRKKNLRICSQAENCRNKSVSKKCKSGYLGIRVTKHGRYNVRITVNRKEIHIGNYGTLEEAIKAREMVEDKYHKQFASHLN